VALFANDAIGNFVMATPILQMMRAEWQPSEIHYFGGSRTRELQDASDLFDRSVCLLGMSADEVRILLDERQSYDLVVNLESSAFAKTMAGLVAGDKTFVAGPCIGSGGRGELPFGMDERGKLWADREWTSETLTARYPFLVTGFISDIFARLCYLEGNLPPYRVPVAPPPISIPEVLIATAASSDDKLWHVASWCELIAALRAQGLRVGLLGAPPAAQAAHWEGAAQEESLLGPDMAEDLRGRLSLPQVCGALASAKGVATLDNGILHLAAAVGAPTVGLYRHGIHRLWAPPVPHLTVLTPGEGGEVRQIPPGTVLEALRRRLREAA
jgi:ADP-heptose:LPS heptosyltransferase